MRGKTALQSGHQRFELVVFLHNQHSLLDCPDRIEVGGNAAAVMVAVHPLAVVIDQLAGNDAGRSVFTHGVHVGRRQRTAFDKMAVVLDTADGIEGKVAVRDRCQLFLDNGLTAQLLRETFGR